LLRLLPATLLDDDLPCPLRPTVLPAEFRLGTDVLQLSLPRLDAFFLFSRSWRLRLGTSMTSATSCVVSGSPGSPYSNAASVFRRLSETLLLLIMSE